MSYSAIPRRRFLKRVLMTTAAAASGSLGTKGLTAASPEADRTQGSRSDTAHIASGSINAAPVNRILKAGIFAQHADGLIRLRR